MGKRDPYQGWDIVGTHKTRLVRRACTHDTVEAGEEGDVLTYTGRFATAHVMIDQIDESTVQQIYAFLNHPAFEGAKIRIMPDCHAGKGACVGFTMPLGKYVLPNCVGVDIHCGIDAWKVGTEPGLYERLEGLDQYIHENVPAGFNVHERFEVTKEHVSLLEEVGEICGKMALDFGRVKRSLGTLGGGNHFISIERENKTGMQWLLVHSGSRNFGLQVCNWHQAVARRWTRAQYGGVGYHDAEYMPMEEGGQAYLDDMYVAARYAQANRDLIARTILRYLWPRTDWRDHEYAEVIKCAHNFIDPGDGILRKGATRAGKGERFLVPLNMRDGTLICVGKGNEDWNCSAPHGAGRQMSRGQAKKTLSLDGYRATMVGIYSTCIGQDTLDEAPDAYKPAEWILDTIGPTAEVVARLQPIYNFKAGKE
jgi:tRNA-splicing ligase RtcB (3'-phosphate/5'-hydroxy nucleic acid ligase)